MRRLAGLYRLLAGAAALIVAIAVSVAPLRSEDADEEAPGIEELVEGFDRIEGLFPLHVDPDSGDLYMEVALDQFGPEFILLSKTVDGVLAAGHFRGFYRDNRVVVLRRHFDRVEIVARNTAFYFDPESPLARAADANISEAVLASVTIAAEDDARVLIDGTALFLTEALHQVKASPDARAGGAGFALGELSAAKTKFRDLRGYPKNTDIVVDYVYDNPAPAPEARGGEAVTDPRYVTIRIQHSFVQAPEPGFEPRLADWRVGYFTERVTDLTSPDPAPYRDLIRRWRLEKKDPEAAVSDPKEPIVWWIENTTPVEYREPLRRGVLAWNAAFEAAGFSNAIVVRQQPDDADWDANDIRYNVIRWASSPRPYFGGYGPSFSNPRTGEIIGADVMVEYAYVANRLALSTLFESAGLPQSAPEGADALALHRQCAAGRHVQMSTLFGLAALETAGAEPGLRSRLVEESLYFLALHEIGHTLGLTHNMRGSDFASLGRAAAGAPGPAPDHLSASVMDYPAVNLAPMGEPQTRFYDTAPGPYDRWAIACGYAPRPADPAGATQARERGVRRTTEPGLAYANDADDMRWPGKGVDPRAMVGDLSDDPIGFAERRLKLVDQTMTGLVQRYAEPGASWQRLHDAYLILTAEQANAYSVISRHVGGLYVNRAAQGQPGGEAPFQPAPLETQQRAMAALSAGVFGPNAFAAPQALARRLQAQPRGFDLAWLRAVCVGVRDSFIVGGGSSLARCSYGLVARFRV